MSLGLPRLAPRVLRLHARGRDLTVWLASGGIWALDQWLAPPHPFISGPINTGAFHFLSWQWLFVTGVLLRAEPRWEPKAISHPRRWTLLAAGAGVLFLWMVRRPELPDWWDADLLTSLTEKTPLALLRILDFGLLAYLFAVLGSRHPSWLTVRHLALLGRHSLPVFTAGIWCAQIALCYPELADSAPGRWLKTVFALLGIVGTAIGCELLHRRRTSR